MISKLLIINSYGLFVWLSFAITAAACIIFYLKTRRTLKKYESEFTIELTNLSNAEKKAVLEKSKIAKQLFISQNKTI